MGHDSDFKSQLVTEICSISTRSIACSHRHGCSNSPAKSSSFIDWYRLLRAYSCLSDNPKRRAFDLERWRKFCFECGTIPYTTHKTSSNANASEHKACNPTSSSRSCKVVKGLKDIRNRFREEARVIENCLRANAAAAPRRESSLFSPPAAYDVFRSRSSRESPIFNPSDHKVQGYPHLRTRIHSKPQNFWHLRTGHQVLNYEPGRATYDSPVFEVRSDRAFFKSRSTCVRS
ncbi:hypothetical protein ACE6H2_001230 [Prunus campanulata]